MKRVVLLGNKGFIGGHLEAGLKRLGLEYCGYDLPEVDLTKACDIPLDAETAVVMTAGVKRQWGDTIDAFNQNITMAANVARALEKQPVGRMIFFSSAAVYGEQHENLHINEETPVRPTSLYGAAKFASECVLRGCAAIRPPLIYGPGDTSKSYGPAGFSHAAKNHETITLWGEGDEKREFIFILDVVEIVARLVSNDYVGPLNIATSTARTFREAAEIAGAKFTTKPRSKPKVDHGFDNRRLTVLFPDFRFRSLEDGMSAL